MDTHADQVSMGVILPGLRESGARVEFVVGDGLGHGSLPPAVETRYFRWLEALANQERSASEEPRRASFVQHPAQ